MRRVADRLYLVEELVERVGAWRNVVPKGEGSAGFEDPSYLL